MCALIYFLDVSCYCELAGSGLETEVLGMDAADASKGTEKSDRTHIDVPNNTMLEIQILEHFVLTRRHWEVFRFKNPKGRSSIANCLESRLSGVEYMMF